MQHADDVRVEDGAKGSVVFDVLGQRPTRDACVGDDDVGRTIATHEVRRGCGKRGLVTHIARVDRRCHGSE